MKRIKYTLILLSLLSLTWAANAVKITSSAQLISGTNANGVIGDYLLMNDSVNFVISDIPNAYSSSNTGGQCIDAALIGGLDEFKLLYLYLNIDWPRQGNYSSIQVISEGSPYDSAHIRVKGVDSDNSGISITTDYILYDNTSSLKLITTFKNNTGSTLSNYGLGDAFDWGLPPFVPGGNSSNGWIASKTPHSTYGYITSEDFEATHGAYWSDATLKEVNILSGDSASISRYFFVSEDLAGIYDTFLDMRNLSIGTASVSVSRNGLPINNAQISFIKEMDSDATIYDYTDNSGFLSIRIETGNWLCRVITDSQMEEQTISISEGTNQDISFILGDAITPTYTQDTLTIIQLPLINIPTMALPGDTLKIEISLPSSEFAQSLSLLFNGNEYDLDFSEVSVSSSFGLRTLEAYLPSEMFYGLYDLKITCTGSDSLDISEQALYIIPEYKDSFTFVHVTDTHLPTHNFWGDEGVDTDTTELDDFREVINDINIINPDFVLHTGDFINDGELEVLGIPSISSAKRLLHELEVPLFLVAGNHDLGGWDSAPAPDGTARRTWWKYLGWGYLNNTSAVATTTQNYSFNYGNTHFIGLEAYNNYDRWREELYGTDSFIASQLQWLNDDLSQNISADLTIAFYHKDFQYQLDLSALGIDAAFWGHIHSNSGDDNISALPLNISTGSTCDGNRRYTLVTVNDNTITSIERFQAGYNGELITKTVSADQSMIKITNNSGVELNNCLVTFPLEDGKKVTSLTNATLFQIDSISSPKIVYAHVNVPANSFVDASIQTDTIETSIEVQLPETPFLLSVYPNPFNPQLTLSYQLSAVGTLNVSVYSILGKHIETIYNGHHEAGNYELTWDASERPSGLYFIRADVKNVTGEFHFVKKCLLMK
ncbi:MAG: metallophosphoesterase [Candidatus Marinimicrobia bacterium]|nr:metallophosphoesterase [Candidatus Neomarinimicrobiota bacterium]